MTSTISHLFATFEMLISHLQRRRTQVCLAQRAYRNRKEATVASLRKDDDDLKIRLLEMESIAHELFQISSSLSCVPEHAIHRVKILPKKQEHHLLPHHMRIAAQAAEGNPAVLYQ
jgi:hypothetical protein